MAAAATAAAMAAATREIAIIILPFPPRPETARHDVREHGRAQQVLCCPTRVPQPRRACSGRPWPGGKRTSRPPPPGTRAPCTFRRNPERERGDRGASAPGLSHRFCGREPRTRCLWGDPPLRWAQPIVSRPGPRLRRGTAVPPSVLPAVPASCALRVLNAPAAQRFGKFTRMGRNRRKFSPWRGLLRPVPLVQAPPP